MKYDKIVEAIFIERPNRFIARVKIDGAEEVELVHVKNTGRCRELLLRGAEVILEDCIEKNPNRKTRYDLIAFVIQMEEISEVRPNTAMHPEFGIALEEAKDAGVEVLSLKCHVGMDRLEIIGENEP